MIYLTQGHENSIGLEILIKSILLLPQKSIDHIKLFIFENTFIKNLNNLNLNYIKNDDHFIVNNKIIKINLCNLIADNESISSINIALSQITQKDILLTLPTSKDQFTENNKTYNGHTDYFRNKFSNNIQMVFKYNNTYCLLLTDHISLKEFNRIDIDSFNNDINDCIKSLKNYYNFNGEIYCAGINPHAGENGQIGTEDIEFQKVINSSNYNIKGLLPADTIHYLHNPNKEQLFIFSYHDQGLIFFKKTFGLLGINMTLGLPFLRMSVDHGTAFELYGKNEANFLSCYYTIQESLKFKS